MVHLFLRIFHKKHCRTSKTIYYINWKLMWQAAILQFIDKTFVANIMRMHGAGSLRARRGGRILDVMPLKPQPLDLVDPKRFKTIQE